MPGREAPVYLTRSPPFDIQTNQLVFYDVVDVSTTAKSGVLSTIVDAGGEARLPDAVTLSDFKLWISFVNGNYKHVKNLSFLDLCTVVKVADALDDQDIAQWSNLAAERLVFHARLDPSGISPDSIAFALSTLADAAHHRIFSVAASAPSILYSLLSFLPPHYHTSVVAAAITQEKALILPFSRDSIPALKVVTTLPKSPPSVLFLHSHDPKAGPDAERHGINIAGHLLPALQHHTNLIGFSVSSDNIDAASAKLLFPAIASLKSLQFLHLGAQECPLPADCMTLLQQALPSLCHLHYLSVSLSGFPRTGVKRPCESEAAQDPHCHAAGLSPTTALTSLHSSIADESQRSWYSATAHLELPHLRQLSVDVSVKDWALTTAFINHLRADPLTSLALQISDQFSAWQRLPDSSMAGARRFVDRLAHFSQLRCLTVVLPHDAKPEDGGADADVMEMMRATAPAVLASLTQLQQVNITTACPVLCSTVPALAAALTAVTCLALHSVPVCRADLIDVPWSDMCTSLCQMKLKELHVTAWPEPERTTDTGTAGLAALRPLTQLSTLRIAGWSCLRAPVDCDALAGMAALRRLSLVECFEDGEPATAMRALLALSALTALTAWPTLEEADEVLVDEMCVRDARAAWPALQELSLCVSGPYSVLKRVVRWSIRLPALKKLAVSPPSVWIGNEGDSEADECRPEDGLEDEYDDIFGLGKFCRRIAAEAGVELSHLEPYDY